MVVDLLELLDAVPPSARAPHLVGGGDENMMKDHGDSLPVHVPAPKPA